MSRPLVGITTGLEPDAAGRAARQVLNLDYVRAVERAGGCPVILPMTGPADALAPVLRLLDGLILTGGPGITEGLVGALPADLPPVHPMRVQAELWAFEAAQERAIPILGICYGMQFLNARFGGTLYGDVQAQLGVGPHSPSRNGGRPVRHPVYVEPGSFLASLTGQASPEVNSHHVQAVVRLGQGLHVSARSADGLVEGIESEDGRIIGVQFHPERMPDTVWEGVFSFLVSRRAPLSRPAAEGPRSPAPHPPAPG